MFLVNVSVTGDFLTGGVRPGQCPGPALAAAAAWWRCVEKCSGQPRLGAGCGALVRLGLWRFGREEFLDQRGDGLRLVVVQHVARVLHQGRAAVAHAQQALVVVGQGVLALEP